MTLYCGIDAPAKNSIRRSSVANCRHIVASEEGNSADLGLKAVERRDGVVIVG